jgi:hypothetical protein
LLLQLFASESAILSLRGHQSSRSEGTLLIGRYESRRHGESGLDP